MRILIGARASIAAIVVALAAQLLICHPASGKQERLAGALLPSRRQ